MTRRACALVVTGDLDLAATWMAWLRGSGYMTLGCAGPVRADACPHHMGRPCPLREASDLTVVDVTADPSWTCTSMGPQPCLSLGPRERSTIHRRSFDELIRAWSEVTVAPEGTSSGPR